MQSFRNVILIAVIFAVMAFCVMPVTAYDVVPNNADKIVPINTTADVHGMPSWATGTIKIQLRCHINTITTGYNLYSDKDNYTAPLYVPFDHNGYSEEQVVAGKYLTKLVPVGDGGRAESSYVTVTNGYDAYPDRELLGQGVSASPKTSVVAITSATYGAPLSFYITSATYGGPGEGKTIDVTNKVAQFIEGNTLHIASDYVHQNYNALFTDPDYGVVKTLTVNYVANGISGTTTVDEEHDLNLVISATGSEDVTAYFQHNLNGNTVMATKTGSSNDWAWLNSFVDFYGPTFYDPSVGIVKSITIDYTVDGNAKSFTTTPNVNGVATTFTLN